MGAMSMVPKIFFFQKLSDDVSITFDEFVNNGEDFMWSITTRTIYYFENTYKLLINVQKIGNFLHFFFLSPPNFTQ